MYETNLFFFFFRSFLFKPAAESVHCIKCKRGTGIGQKGVSPSKYSCEEIKESIPTKGAWTICTRSIHQLRRTSKMDFRKCRRETPRVDTEMYGSSDWQEGISYHWVVTLQLKVPVCIFYQSNWKAMVLVRLKISLTCREASKRRLTKKILWIRVETDREWILVVGRTHHLIVYISISSDCWLLQLTKLVLLEKDCILNPPSAYYSKPFCWFPFNTEKKGFKFKYIFQYLSLNGNGEIQRSNILTNGVYFN